MSFIESKQNIRYMPGYFLASEECTRETVQVSPSHSQVVTMADGSKYVPAGAVVPSNDGNAKGILYEDVDVSTGAMPGSLVTKGIVYEDRLPAAIESSAEAVLPGITVITTSPAMTRPASFDKNEMETITVTSEAGSGAGKTDVSLSGYTPASGERYVYKIASAVQPLALGQILSVGSSAGQWTAATFPLDELTATTGQKITVASVDNINAVVAGGSETITAKANG